MLSLIESSEYAVWARESLWGWPTLLTIHVLGNALVVGLMFIIGLRLLGVFETISYSSLRRLFPVIWVGFAVQFITGFALWATKPTRYIADTAFTLKLVLVIVGVILSVYFYGAVKRESASWDTGGAVSSSTLRFATVSMLVWCGVVIAGRLTAHLGALYAG